MKTIESSEFPLPEPSWREAFSVALLPFLLSRIWIALWTYIGHINFPYRKAVPGGYVGVDNWWLNPWTTYDTQHFLEIARQGYSPQTVPFQPLFPMLLRLFGPDEIHMALWGVFLNNVCFCVALTILFLLTKTVAPTNIARLALWILAFYPTSAIFSAVYTESVFAVFLFASWWQARHQKWIIAALFGVLASLTRNVGLLVSAGLLMEWWSQTRLQRPENLPHADPKKNWWSALVLLLPLGCFVCLQWYFSQLFADQMAGINAQTYYYRSFMLPFIPVAKDLADIFSGRAVDAVTILHVASVFAVPVLAYRFRRQLPVADAVYMLGLLLMHLTYARYIPPRTIATLRYMSTTPCFTPLLARALEKANERPFSRWILTAAYLLLCALFSFLFGQKQFALG